MNTSPQTIEDSIFKGFIPLNTLDHQTLEKLASQATIEQIAAGNFLFERGDTRHRTLFLLEGEIELCSPVFPTQKISAGTDAGRYPLAHTFPRQFTALTVSNTRILVLPVDILEIIPAENMKAKPSSTGSTRDAWKTQWLNSPMLRSLPDANKEALLSKMEEIKAQAGQVIIHQDEPADGYFVIKKGRCSVSRRPAPGARDVKLAEIAEGHGFGEEALITNVPRNASVTMLSDGSLLRLSKQDFITLLARPLLHHLPFANAIELVEQGAVLIDVRAPEEFEIDGLIGSLNMPLPVLRLKANRLHRDSTYIVYSNTGNFSSVAAFLLIQQGLKAYVLQGGLSTAPKYRMKRGAFNDHDPEAHTTSSSLSKVLTFPHGEDANHNQSGNTHQHNDFAAKQPSTPVDWNLISDDVLWRSTIGYRQDSSVEAAMTPKAEVVTQPVTDSTLQGFDDIKLFTKVASVQDIKISGSDDAEPVVAFPQSQSPQGAQTAHAMTQRRQTTQPSWPQDKLLRSSSSKRWIISAGVTLALLVGVISYFYFTNGSIQTTSPLLLEQQRKLDAKVTRLMDAIQALQDLKKQHTESDRSTNSGNNSVSQKGDSSGEQPTSTSQGQIIRTPQNQVPPPTDKNK